MFVHVLTRIRLEDETTGGAECPDLRGVVLADPDGNEFCLLG
jgi:hypothetical protein